MDIDTLAHSWAQHAQSVRTPTPAYLKNGKHWSTQRVQEADGSDYDWASLIAEDPDGHWPVVAEATIVEPDTTGYREMGGHRVGVLYAPERRVPWLAYDAKQDERGMWVVEGQIANTLAHAASRLAPEHRVALGLPANPVVRPSADELTEMFPPHRDAVKAAWRHDEQYVTEVEAAEFLSALGEHGDHFAQLQVSPGTYGKWTDDAAHYASPLEGNRWSNHFSYGHTENQLTVTDKDGNPVEFDGETVKSWIDKDATGHTGWRPVAMVKPKTSSIERKKPRARTFYRTDRHNAYGIAHNETTGEWAVYNTVDTSTSSNWQYGRDGYAWETRVVVSRDINAVAAHLTVQQREALGLPGNPDSTADRDTNTDTRKVA